jgi:hypothetical protein
LDPALLACRAPKWGGKFSRRRRLLCFDWKQHRWLPALYVSVSSRIDRKRRAAGRACEHGRAGSFDVLIALMFLGTAVGGVTESLILKRDGEHKC